MSRVWTCVAFVALWIPAAPILSQTPVWTPHLSACVKAIDEGEWQPPADDITQVYGRIEVTGTPGFWVYPALWVSVQIPEDPNLQPIYEQLLAKFPFLQKQPPCWLNGLPGASGGPVLEVPDSMINPLLQLALGTGANPESPLAVRRAWQPICAASGQIDGPPSPNTPSQTRTWSCDPSVWQSSGTQELPYPTLLNDWWLKSAASSADRTIIDFDVLGQKALIQQSQIIPPAPGESPYTFFNSGPENPIEWMDTWCDYAKWLGLTLEIQFIGLVSTSHDHLTTADEGSTGGITDLADPDSPPMISWSDKLSVTFYLPRPPMDAEPLSLNLNDPPTPTLIVGGVLSLPLRSVVTPINIRMKDGAGTVHLLPMHWLGVGQWGLTVPPTFAPGTGSIVSILTPLDSLSGAGQPWSTLIY
jgi:hypothetical protein